MVLDVSLEALGVIVGLLVLAVVWLAIEVRRVHATVEPIANSSAVRLATSF